MTNPLNGFESKFLKLNKIRYLWIEMGHWIILWKLLYILRFPSEYSWRAYLHMHSRFVTIFCVYLSQHVGAAQRRDRDWVNGRLVQLGCSHCMYEKTALMVPASPVSHCGVFAQLKPLLYTYRSPLILVL